MQKVFRLWAVPSGTEADEPLQATKKRGNGTFSKLLSKSLKKGEVLDSNAEGWKADGGKGRVTGKRVQQDEGKRLKSEVS